MRDAMIWATGIVTFVLVRPYLEWMVWPLQNVCALAIIMLAISPLLIWEGWYPRYFDITAREDGTFYEFRSFNYYVDFAEQNGQLSDEQKRLISLLLGRRF